MVTRFNCLLECMTIFLSLKALKRFKLVHVRAKLHANIECIEKVKWEKGTAFRSMEATEVLNKLTERSLLSIFGFILPFSYYAN